MSNEKRFTINYKDWTGMACVFGVDDTHDMAEVLKLIIHAGGTDIVVPGFYKEISTIERAAR